VAKSTASKNSANRIDRIDRIDRIAGQRKRNAYATAKGATQAGTYPRACTQSKALDQLLSMRA
jgi:hypothetical protein